MGLAVGLGLGISHGGPTFNPASLGATLLNWFEAVPGSLLDGSNVAVTDAGPITKWIDRRDTAGSQTRPYLTATAAGLTFGQAARAVTFDGTNYFNVSVPYTAPILGCTFYVVTSSGSVYAVGAATDKTAVISVAGQPDFVDSSGNGAANTSAPFTGGLIRCLANSNFNQGIRVAATGLTEAFDNLGTDFTVGLVGAYTDQGSVLQPTPAGSTIRAVLVVQQDTIRAGTDGGIRSYLAGRFGVSL